MISVREAERIILDAVASFDHQVVNIEDAVGRTLAEPILAERDHPPFDRVTMDGAAIVWQETLPTLNIVGTQLAGEPRQTLPDAQSAIEIMTGAPMSNGADTVIPVERYSVTEKQSSLELLPEAHYAPTKGQFIHRAGSDHKAGSTLLQAGAVIGGIETAILASAGRTTVKVCQLPCVAVIATGDELVAAGAPIQEHQIRMSNAPALIAALDRHGFPSASLHHLRDSREKLHTALSDLLDSHQVLILSGGVSKGKADFVPEVLLELGVKRHFHFVAQRPGKPMWFGMGPKGQLIFALPGNPVSTLTCFRRYVIPALQKASAQHQTGRPTAKLANDWHFKPALTAFVPVFIQPDNAGQLWATPLATNTSGDFAALAGTDGILQLPAKRKDFACGEAFPFYRW